MSRESFDRDQALRLLALAQEFGTPAYLTDIARLDHDALEIEQSFPDPWIRNYSLKANPLPALVRRLASRGWGANVVSSGEWDAASEAGLSNDRITLEGIGKTDDDLAAAVHAAEVGDPLRWVVLESVDELQAMNEFARQSQSRAAQPMAIDVLIRINPGVQPETSAGLAVGLGASKFGMAEAELEEIAQSGWLGSSSPMRLRGVHVHVGSQLEKTTAWVQGAVLAVRMLHKLRTLMKDEAVDTVDLGGGFGVGPSDTYPEPREFRHSLDDALRANRLATPGRLAIEPGRRVIAASGTILASVLHVRERSGRPQVILDTGMTELMRPAMYGARHGVESPGRRDETLQLTAVEGPICESADTFGLHLLPRLKRGDVVAIGQTGAYGSSFGSTYNGRPRPCQVFVMPNGESMLARERGKDRW